MITLRDAFTWRDFSCMNITSFFALHSGTQRFFIKEENFWIQREEGSQRKNLYIEGNNETGL